MTLWWYSLFDSLSVPHAFFIGDFRRAGVARWALHSQTGSCHPRFHSWVLACSITSVFVSAGRNEYVSWVRFCECCGRWMLFF